MSTIPRPVGESRYPTCVQIERDREILKKIRTFANMKYISYFDLNLSLNFRMKVD